MKRPIAAILVLLSLLAVAIIAAPTTTAQEPAPFYWEFINVDIDVQENGDMLIMETQKYVFTSSQLIPPSSFLIFLMSIRKGTESLSHTLFLSMCWRYPN